MVFQLRTGQLEDRDQWMPVSSAQVTERKQAYWNWFIQVQLGSSIYTNSLRYYLKKQPPDRVKNLLTMY